MDITHNEITCKINANDLSKSHVFVPRSFSFAPQPQVPEDKPRGLGPAWAMSTVSISELLTPSQEQATQERWQVSASRPPSHLFQLQSSRMPCQCWPCMLPPGRSGEQERPLPGQCLIFSSSSTGCFLHPRSCWALLGALSMISSLPSFRLLPTLTSRLFLQS